MSLITSLPATGLGALQAHATSMAFVAHNVANVSTAGFVPAHAAHATGPGGNGVRVDGVLPDGLQLPDSGENESSPVSGTDIAHEFALMISTERAFEANAKTIVTADEMLGCLINTVG